MLFKRRFIIKKFIILLTISLCLFGYKSYAQLGFCGGNSGDPIFIEDFGVGTSNNALPAGTTTYNFSNGFPNDGFYTVSNGSFGNGFDWHQTEDHTPGDTNGKCLIVNAEFSAGEFYRTSVSGLCETTTYEFSAWLLNLVIAGSFCSTQPSGTIPINVRFEIWDSTDSNLLASGDTGNIIETSTPNWEEYGLVFQTLAGQNTVILKMINNGQGGCGNDLAIDDIEFKSCGDAITIEDTLNNDSVSLCSGETPFSTTLTVTPDNSVFTNHFYQWQESPDAINWTDIPGEITETLDIFGITSTMYYRAKVAEFSANLNDSDCITFSDTFEVIVTQAANPPTIECWETATLNNTTCTWEVTGTQPTEPTNLECWETTTFNTTTCAWEITGTQPGQPSLECWETATFNTTTCVWDVSGMQPTEPTGLECWEITTFNDATCAWEITGTQPIEPTNLECWETTVFNTATCIWDINGDQPEQPDLDCWETAIFNTVSCNWDVSGTQPIEPTGLDCWETTSFNDATCAWDITGTQPAEPTDINCWETTSFNTTSCSWEISGTQPIEPTNLECWEVTSFNTTTCQWEISGEQPEEPDNLECWQTAIFNDTTCVWDVSGTEPIDSLQETVSFCEGDDVILSGNINEPNSIYLWDTGAVTEEITVTQPGTYSVEITSNSCITTIKTITVIENLIPIIESVFSDGSSIIIAMQNTGEFEYSLDGNQYQSSSIFNNVPGGLYTIYVREINDCGIVTFEHLHFKIPKFFTPNSDGVNDVFDLSGIEFFSRSEVYIFNRYGKLIKSSKNQRFVWDGTFNNQEMPNSDYWYYIKIDNQEFRGHFTLRR